MTPEEMNALLKEANTSADRAIESAKRTLLTVQSMEILDKKSMLSYFKNRLGRQKERHNESTIMSSL